MSMHYGYYIDLNERGGFSASVRDINDKTVYTIRAGNELSEDETSIFDDGFMRHQDDVSGLTKYLQQLGVIPGYALVLVDKDFERKVAERDSATLAYLALEGDAATKGFVAVPLTEHAVWDIEGLRDIETECLRRNEDPGAVCFPDGHAEWRGVTAAHPARTYEDGKARFCATVDGQVVRTEAFDIDELVAHADDGDFVLVASDQDALRSLLEEQGVIPAGAKPV